MTAARLLLLLLVFLEVVSIVEVGVGSLFELVVEVFHVVVELHPYFLHVFDIALEFEIVLVVLLGVLLFVALQFSLLVL